MLEDSIDERFRENDLISLISSTLVYHQLIESMMYSLLIHFKYLEDIKNDSVSNKNLKKLNRFTEVLGKVKELDNNELFEEKEEFVEKCSKINKLRNKLAHEIIKSNEKNLIKKVNEVNELYHEIQHLYETVAKRIFDYIHPNITLDELILCC